MPRSPERLRSFVPAETSLLNPAVLGPDRGAFASNPGRGHRHDPSGHRPGEPATFTPLCDRRKFGMVVVRTAVLSQFAVANPAQGLQREIGVEMPKDEGHGLSGDSERPGVN